MGGGASTARHSPDQAQPERQNRNGARSFGDDSAALEKLVEIFSNPLAETPGVGALPNGGFGPADLGRERELFPRAAGEKLGERRSLRDTLPTVPA